MWDARAYSCQLHCQRFLASYRKTMLDNQIECLVLHTHTHTHTHARTHTHTHTHCYVAIHTSRHTMYLPPLTSKIIASIKCVSYKTDSSTPHLADQVHYPDHSHKPNPNPKRHTRSVVYQALVRIMHLTAPDPHCG